MSDLRVPPFRRLRSLLAAERGDLWVALIFSVAIGVLSLTIPVATQAVVNTIAFGTLLQPLLILSLLVLGVLVVAAILQILRFRVVEVLQRRILVRLASESVHRLVRARTDALQSNNGPELVNRFLDVVTVQKAGATLLVDGMSVAMQTLIGMILLGLYHPWLLAFDAVLAAALLLVIFPLGSGGIRTAVEESKAKYALVAWLEEVARNTGTFRGASEADYALKRCDELVRGYLGHRGGHFRVVLRQFAGSLALQAFASAALLGVGGVLVIQRQLTLGQLVAAELVVAAILAGISKLAKHLETYYDLLAGLDKLGMLTDIEIERSGQETMESLEPASLTVKTPEYRLEIAPGEKVGITGLSGSGKSMLLDAIAGYTAKNDRVVELDGVDLRNLQLVDVRTQVALVRGVELFQGTILENVRVGREVSLAAVQTALEDAGVWNQVQNLPLGLETVLATGGAPLPEGFRQALMIARAVLGSPRLLMIDESLDLVQDTAEREKLTDVLFHSGAPWTLLVVSSHPNVLGRCSRIVHLEEGRIQEAA